MFDLRPVAFVIGRILVVLGAAMLIPAAVDWQMGDANAGALAASALMTGVAGIALSIATVNALGRSLDVRQAYVLTALIWAVVPAFGALPYIIGQPGLSFLLAYFEAVSGFTTTGASVIPKVETYSAGMLLWRGMTNFLGGLGIAFIAMIFLPLMRIGGMQFFRTEGFDTFGKALPRAADIAWQLLIVYTGLTFVCILVYAMIGMGVLDAVVHGMATVATGGFSTADASFSRFTGAGEYAGAVFMILGSLPYIRYVQLVNGSAHPLWADSQARAYLRWLLTAVLIVSVWRTATSDMAFLDAFRESLFNLTSIMSSTGFGSGSFSTWGGPMLVVAFVIGVIGACSGSSAAGLSVFRVQLAIAAVRSDLQRIAHPSRIEPIRYDGRRVEPDVIDALILFVAGFIVILGLASIGITLTGVDQMSALWGAWTTLGNIGYSLGPLVARTGTFVDYPPTAIAIMTLAMILGRLGLLAILVLFLPRFWRR
jgi:trk system potassium uptake protein